MKLLTKILGASKILWALCLFCADWIILINYILQGLQNGWQTSGFFLAFCMMLFYSLFLGYSGYENITGKRVLSPVVRWAGILFGFAIGMFLFSYTETMAGRIFTQFFSAFSVVDIIVLIIKKPATADGIDGQT